VDQINADIERRRAAGDAEAGRENASGMAYPPGHDALRRNGHLVTRALRHGVLPQALRELPLPHNRALMTCVDQDDTPE